jgi:hypothetical protein
MTISDRDIEEGRRRVYEAVNATRKKHGLPLVEFRVEPDPIFCSFCGKEPHDVSNMIEGAGIFICDQCIRTCVGIITDEGS